MSLSLHPAGCLRQSMSAALPFRCSLLHLLLSVHGFSLRAPSPPHRALAGAKEFAFSAHPRTSPGLAGVGGGSMAKTFPVVSAAAAVGASSPTTSVPPCAASSAPVSRTATTASASRPAAGGGLAERSTIDAIRKKLCRGSLMNAQDQSPEDLANRTPGGGSSRNPALDARRSLLDREPRGREDGGLGTRRGRAVLVHALARNGGVFRGR